MVLGGRAAASKRKQAADEGETSPRKKKEPALHDSHAGVGETGLLRALVERTLSTPSMLTR